MNRVEIKTKAKEMIKGNKWYIWKPILTIGLCIVLIECLAFALDSAFGLTTTTTSELFGQTVTNTQGGPISLVVGIFTSIASAAFAVGYASYVLSFVRGKKLEINDILEFMKKHWVISLLTGLIVGLIVVAGMILLVIPGIIASIGLMFYKEVCADNPEMKAMDIVKKAWQMTNGHKMELFVLGLSFIGWGILSGFTLGLLLIWLIPYITITVALTYEEIKKTS